MVDARTLGRTDDKRGPFERAPAQQPLPPQQQGQPHALSDSLAVLHEASFGWALACCGRDRVVAEDVLQDAYFKVLDGHARFEGRSSLKTWLFGVIRMTAREHRRRFSIVRLFNSERDETSSIDMTPDSRRAPDSEAAAKQRAEQLSHALAKLAERQREVLHLVFYEGLSIAEAAQIMGVALGTARQHYERGKHALVRLLEDPSSAGTVGTAGTTNDKGVMP